MVSLNVQRLFDLQGDTDVASRFRTLEGIQRVSSQQEGALYTLSPAVDVQLTPTLSLGAAFSIRSNFLLDDGWEQKRCLCRGRGGSSAATASCRLSPQDVSKRTTPLTASM